MSSILALAAKFLALSVRFFRIIYKEAERYGYKNGCYKK
jgi:hypothetical protein